MKQNALLIALRALLVFAAIVPSVAEAQVTTATLAGIVTDETGGALPGATVTIRSLETDLVRTLTTDSDGRYRAAGLEPGAYELSVELRGFQTKRHPDIRLSLGQSLTLNVTVGVGRLEVSSRSPAKHR